MRNDKHNIEEGEKRQIRGRSYTSICLNQGAKLSLSTEQNRSIVLTFKLYKRLSHRVQTTCHTPAPKKLPHMKGTETARSSAICNGCANLFCLQLWSIPLA
jgi:hypothetical protein